MNALLVGTGCQRRTGFDAGTVQRALHALYSEPYLSDDGKTEASDNQIIFVGPPMGEGRRVAGAWPTPENLLERLVVALEAAAEGRGPAVKRSAASSSRLPYGPVERRPQVAIAALGGAGGNIITS